MRWQIENVSIECDSSTCYMGVVPIYIPVLINGLHFREIFKVNFFTYYKFSFTIFVFELIDYIFSYDMERLFDIGRRVQICLYVFPIRFKCNNIAKLMLKNFFLDYATGFIGIKRELNDLLFVVFWPLNIEYSIIVSSDKMQLDHWLGTTKLY